LPGTAHALCSDSVARKRREIDARSPPSYARSVAAIPVAAPWNDFQFNPQSIYQVRLVYPGCRQRPEG
jgi:hypothetical protein